MTRNKKSINSNRLGGQKKDLNLSLTNRLSRNGRLGRDGLGVKQRPLDIKRNTGIQSRLCRPDEPSRLSVHDRLSHNKPVKRLQTSLNTAGFQRRGLTSKNNDDLPPIKLNSGAVVKGLRSDQMMLHKSKDEKKHKVQDKMDRLRALQTKRGRNEREPLGRSSATVSLDVNHGLTVSIANKAAIKPKNRPERRPRRAKSPSTSSSEMSPASSRKKDKEALRICPERPPLPPPHRQVLDPSVQREIATLQQLTDPKSAGPGPGVKGFRLSPARTQHTLHERFTLERSAAAAMTMV